MFSLEPKKPLTGEQLYNRTKKDLENLRFKFKEDEKNLMALLEQYREQMAMERIKEQSQ